MTLALEAEICSKARISRDARFDGLFFTAVKTTGIYCRPICPARTPMESNVAYYPTAASAAEAGFRPCLRCRPESAPGTPVWRGTEATVSRALTLINQGILDEQSVEDLSNRLGISSRHLRQLFERHVGASPVSFAQTRRVHFAKQLLNETSLPITEVALASGFGSIRRFNQVFKNAFGRNPREFKKALGAKVRAAAGPGTTSCRLMLTYRPPYDWSAMISFFELRGIHSVESVRAGVYTRAFRLVDCSGVLELKEIPGKNAISLTVHLDQVGSLLPVVSKVRKLLDLDANMGAIHEDLGKDPKLGPLLSRYPGLRLPGAWDPFEFAVRAVLGQQISVKAATTIADRIARKFGPAIPFPAPEGLTHFFPTAQELAGQDLHGLGLTRKRAETLGNMINNIADGTVRLAVDEDLDGFVKAFTRLPGIGAWTAHYVAMRGLSEPDAFPEADLGIIKAMSPGEARLPVKQIRARAENWSPWRSYAAIYLWKSLSADV